MYILNVLTILCQPYLSKAEIFLKFTLINSVYNTELINAFLPVCFHEVKYA